MRRTNRFHTQSRFSTPSSTNTSTTANKDLPFLRQHHHVEISKLPEVKARDKLRSFLEYISKNESHNNTNKMMEEYSRYGFGTLTGKTNPLSTCPKSITSQNILSTDQVKVILETSIASFHLHVESRVAALCGKGFYTIGNS